MKWWISIKMGVCEGMAGGKSNQSRIGNHRTGRILTKKNYPPEYSKRRELGTCVLQIIWPVLYLGLEGWR